MNIGQEIAKLTGRLITPARAGDGKLAGMKQGMTAPLRITSTSFQIGGPIPARYAGETGISPQLSWSGVPPKAQELALLCEDPDAPLHKPFVHWLVYGMPASLYTLPESASGFVPAGSQEGQSSSHKLGYTGPKPPPGHGVHHYHFQLFALDTPLRLKPGADREALVDAMQNRVIGFGELIGTFQIS